jgi:hypothetical protein
MKNKTTQILGVEQDFLVDKSSTISGFRLNTAYGFCPVNCAPTKRSADAGHLKPVSQSIKCERFFIPSPLTQLTIQQD